uniref:Uncharacterized protein n=1 Tax=Tetradesmus obliquus TaxID=3088 RepID=A0A383VTE4_TETOB|eukprot:jgi/Sobl393_1/14520/SZX68190.1
MVKAAVKAAIQKAVTTKTTTAPAAAPAATKKESAAATNTKQQYGMPGMPGMPGYGGMPGMGMPGMGMPGYGGGMMPGYGGGMYVDPCIATCAGLSGSGAAGACFNSKGNGECCCKNSGCWKASSFGCYTCVSDSYHC